jgi:hypothetical protein
MQSFQIIEGYVPVDGFFGAPYVDIDEERAAPVPHRYVHGGFEGTATRFSFYFPPGCDRRFFHYLEGAYGGNENASALFTVDGRSQIGGGLGFAASREGFFVESNQGHIGAEVCPKAGDDGSVYSYRASAESARLARHVANAVYGAAPEHGYVYGGSGGGARTKLCIEYTEDGVWDAGVAFVAGGASTIRNYSAMNNASRVLGARAQQVADAMEPGGSGYPFEGLTIEQREALADLYAAGFSRGAERSVADDLNCGFLLWSWQAGHLVQRHRDYFEAFWSEPGHAGADGDLNESVINLKTTVGATVTREEAGAYPLSTIGQIIIGVTAGPEKKVGVVLAEDPPELVEGSRITILSGAAVGRELYCLASGGRLLVGSAIGEPQELLFHGVEPGDEVHIDNRDYLAYCFYYRHHLPAPEQMRRFSVDGRPLYPQYDFKDTDTYAAPMGAMENTGAIRRPLFLIQNMFDTSCWAIDAVIYDAAVRAYLGESVGDRWRLWFLENGEHMPASMVMPGPAPVPATRLIEYGGTQEAALDAMVAWIERGEDPPAPTTYSFDQWDNRVELAATAGERCGIQPVVTATANGAARADVRAGEEFDLVAEAEVPPGVGAIVEIAWDFDGTGSWPQVHPQESPSPSTRHETRHRFDTPGTYFPVVRVLSHPKGDLDDPYARVMNLARCRVVVH